MSTDAPYWRRCAAEPVHQACPRCPSSPTCSTPPPWWSRAYAKWLAQSAQAGQQHLLTQLLQMLTKGGAVAGAWSRVLQDLPFSCWSWVSSHARCTLACVSRQTKTLSELRSWQSVKQLAPVRPHEAKVARLM